MRDKKRCIAIILAAGQGKRMGTSIQKQFLELNGKPVIAHTAAVFEQSDMIDDILLVTGQGQEEFVRREIVEKFGLSKIRGLASGGQERYHSVWNGLKAMKACCGLENLENILVFIHDGARPFVDEEILTRQYQDAQQYQTSVAGMPSKDTVKIVDEEGYAVKTPNRKYVWTVQTPQVFDAALIYTAYEKMLRMENIEATDDAMAVEKYMAVPVKMTEGSYRNIKITTPEDMEIAKAFLEK